MSKRAGLLLCVMLALSCERQTGYCERPEDCTVTVSKTMLGGSAADGAGGTISSDPSKLLCDVTCQGSQAIFPMGVGVKLTVEPAPGWRFAGWSGPCEGVTPTCTVQVGPAKEVKARFVRKVCSQDNWCWENPLPTGNDLRSVWAVTSNDVWAVGVPRTLVHWDGNFWTGVNLSDEPEARYSSIWASGSKDVWVTAYNNDKDYSPLSYPHWDGNSWSRVPIAPGTNTLGHIWGTSSTDVWAAGDGGSIAHYDGTSWSGQPANVGVHLRGVWSSTAMNDVWVVGAGGTLLHGGKNGWTKVAAPADAMQVYFDPVWGSGTNDVWAASSRIIYWNGSVWTTKDVGLPYNLISAIWGADKNDVWFAESSSILHWDGKSFGRSTTLTGSSLSGLHGSNPNDVWSVGSRGTILHYDGVTWSSAASSVTTDRITSIRGSGSSDIWATVNDGAILHWDGVKWSNVQNQKTKPLSKVWINSPTDVWVVGSEGTLLHWDGKEVWHPIDCNTRINLRTIWASGPDDVWAAGTSGDIKTGVIVHYTNGVCTAEGPAEPQWGIWGREKDLWVAGASGRILRRRGPGDWVNESTNTTQYFNGISAGVSGDLWAVSETVDMTNKGSIFRRRSDTGAWEPVKVDPAKDPMSIDPMITIWVSDDGNDIWAGGRNGALWRSSNAGLTWTKLTSGLPDIIVNIWGTGLGSSHVWAVGPEGGAILHYQK